MRSSLESWLPVLVGASFALIALGAMPFLTPRADADPADDAGPATPLVGEAPSSPADGNTPAEGVELHGQWTIEVRNAEGELVEVREVENALTAEGRLLLARGLGRQWSFGLWGLAAEGSNPNSQLCELACVVQPRDVAVSFGLPPDPQLGRPDERGKVFLEGTTEVQNAGNIAVLYTGLGVCDRPGELCTREPGGVSLTGGGAGRFPGAGSFTRATLGAPLSVSAGDRVTMKVVLTFS